MQHASRITQHAKPFVCKQTPTKTTPGYHSGWLFYLSRSLKLAARSSNRGGTTAPTKTGEGCLALVLMWELACKRMGKHFGCRQTPTVCSARLFLRGACCVLREAAAERPTSGQKKRRPEGADNSLARESYTERTPQSMDGTSSTQLLCGHMFAFTFAIKTFRLAP